MYKESVKEARNGVSNKLLSLPVELQLEIFIIAQNPALAYACSHYWKITQSFVVRGTYILQRFGPEAALSQRAIKQKIMSKEVIRYLLEQIKCNPLADEDWLFTRACEKPQEIQVCEWIIKAVLKRSQGGEEGEGEGEQVESEQHPEACTINSNNNENSNDNTTMVNTNTLTATMKRLLNIASMKGSVEVIEMMIKDFNITIDPTVHQSMLDIAFNENQIEVIRYLKERHHFNLHIQDERYLREASLRGREAIVSYLIQDGANVHSLNDAALQNAAYRGHPAIVDLLLTAGANAVVNHNSPLKYAVTNNDLASVKYLVSTGANPRYFEDWPLRMACRHGQHHMVQLLVSFDGMDINTLNGMPLNEALMAGHESTVRILLEEGADPNSLGALYGLRFLIETSYKKKNNVLVKMMIQAGSDLSRLNF